MGVPVSAVSHPPAASALGRRHLGPAPRQLWLVAALTGTAVAWPLLFAMLFHGPAILIHCLTGDSYHYLAIARKAMGSHFYTYDGVHPTNGFHPLWEYTLRAVFTLLHLHTHQSQAVCAMLLALAATTLGAMFASAAIGRLTAQPWLGLLVAPGLYFLVVGVHVRNLWIWASLDGMESAFSLFFGGLFFFAASHFLAASTPASDTPASDAPTPFDTLAASRVLGLILPLVILSRLDDVFLVPALLAALLLFEPARGRRLAAGLWIAAPSFLALVVYLVYNKLTVGAAMPLSGGTKAGFVAPLNLFMTAAVHFAPLLELKALLTHKPAEGTTVFANSFRFVEQFYPALFAAFGAVFLWRSARRRPVSMLFFAFCLYILFKLGYNFLFVHPWHQAAWYYALIVLGLSVMGASALRGPWIRLGAVPLAKYAVVTVYVLVLLLSGSQYYAQIAFTDPPSDQLWARRDLIRQRLLASGVHGILNVDDGITAFLLDLPNLHGFAFATDVQAQNAHTQGAMLSLAYARGINCITGFDYMVTDTPPATDAQIRQYLRQSLAGEIMTADLDRFDFSLVYYDPVLKLPFIAFRPRASAVVPAGLPPGPAPFSTAKHL